MNASSRILIICTAFSALLSCAGAPEAPPAPVPAPMPVPDVPLALSVENAAASPRGLREVSISFVLRVENTENRPVRLDSLAWSLAVDGSAVPGGPSSASRELAPGEPFDATFETIVPIPEGDRNTAAFTIEASATRVLADGSPLVSTARGGGEFPVIRPPVFSIRRIKIKKAELINTRFEVVLRVENPNAVPLTFDALNYELYGEGRRWTDGSSAESFTVGANGAVDKKLMLVMNFIDMKRDLLDQVIRLEVVDYRFTGDARITPALKDFPEFVLPYELDGRTSVIE